MSYRPIRAEVRSQGERFLPGGQGEDARDTFSGAVYEKRPLLVEMLKDERLQQKKNRLFFGEAYQNNDLVCCHPDGRPIHNHTLGSHFRDVARRAGLEISFHTLRHSHASLLLKMEENLKVISERLGHSGIRITVDTYAHLYSDAQKGAARKIATVLPMGI